MLRVERLQQILNLMQRQGSVSVAELARHLQVAEQTIRRDLSQLETEGLILRDHGGAMLAVGAAPAVRDEDRPLLERLGEGADAKWLIGQTAAALIRDSQTVIFDAGSTTLAVAEALEPRRDLTVITNALPIAETLLERPGVDVFLAGGMLRQATQSTVGPAARQAFEGLNADMLFLGAAGVSVQEGLTNSNLFEVEVKGAMIAAARQVVLVVHGAKFGRVTRYSFAPIRTVHVVVTDRSAPASVLEELAGAGIKVIVAGEEG